jgi:serine/threonine protein kinase
MMGRASAGQPLEEETFRKPGRTGALSLRLHRSRANMTKSLPSLSHPVAVRPSDEAAPADRAAKGYLCPRCHRSFEEDAGLHACPDDHAPLVRAIDLAAAGGDEMLGRVLAARFTILARLGAGSMGTVYRAKQAPIGRDVAIKILRSDRAIDEVSRARFLREARANSLLTSPNTVTVFDFGQSESGDFYLAMELLEGESLGQRIKRLGRIGIDEAIETAKQALRSLAEAHAKGVIHRDLKPDNLFYARVQTNATFEEIVKVLDFGIAKMLHADGELAMNAIETQAGTVFGTPRYMSPEQAQGKPLDARSDLYSLGVILYHMLTGRPPFTDDDAIVVMARHIKTVPRPMTEVAPEARIPPEVESLVMRVLSKEPEKRPQTADALAAELSRINKDGAVVTSGVRASLSGGVELTVDRGRSVPPLPPASALTYDTLSAPAGLPPPSRRWIIAAAAIGVVALVATIAIASGFHRGAPSATAPTWKSAPATAEMASVPTAFSLPSAPAASVPSKILTTAAGGGPTSLPISARPDPSHPESKPERRTQKPAAHLPSAGSKPASTSSVGYGYLE